MAVPTIASVTPSTGTYAGGTAVLIAGTGFTGTTGVTFDGTAADFEVSSGSLLAAVTPAHEAAAARIVVTSADGASTSAVDYTYTGTGVGIFTVAEARAFDKAQLTSATTYPSATITAQEAAIREKFERIVGVAFIPTISTEYYDGDGTDSLYLTHHNPWTVSTPAPVTLTSVTVISTDDTETAFTAAELTDVVKYPHKLVRRSGTFASGSRNIKVVYTHGHATVPVDIKHAALQALLLPPPDGIVPGSVPSAVIDGTDGTINWSRVKDPARGRWFGNEAIDAVLREHQSIETLPGIA